MRSIARVLLFILAAIFSDSVLAQGERNHARIAWEGREQVQQLLEKELILDSARPPGIHAWVSQDEFEWIRGQGWAVEWVAAAPQDFWDEPASLPKAITYPLQRYPTYADIVSELQSFSQVYPSICRLVSIGKSKQGKDLYFLKMTDLPDIEEDEPEVKLVSTMHGNEALGTVLMLNLIHLLLTEYGQDPALTELINSAELWIMPLMNPDGYSMNPRSRFNGNGADLNRSFPDRISDPNNAITGRQPETQAMMLFNQEHSPVLSANFHTGELVVNYPYDNSAYNYIHEHPDWHTPDDDVFVENSLQYSRNNPALYASPYFDQGITNGIAWYSMTGGMQDWNYVWHSCMEVTVEVSESFAPPVSELSAYWDSNRDSLLTYIGQARRGIRGIVSDSQTGLPLAAKVHVKGRAKDMFTDPDCGDYHRMLLMGNYSVTFSSEGFRPKTIHNVVVPASGEVRLDVRLDPAFSGMLVR